MAETVENEMGIWWYRVYKAGYPTCCEHHARFYWIVMYDIGKKGETTYTMSLN